MSKSKQARKNGDKRTTSGRAVKDSTDNLLMVWRFDSIDRDGCFRFDVSREDFNAEFILEKIIEYSRREWIRIKSDTHDNNRSKHHYIRHAELSAEAWERIRAKRLDDHLDGLFSLALDNKIRVLGIREREFFRVIWYDPEHRFCPSHLRNT
ncbi:MAG: hypothetical protein LBC28_01185 [Oscillospiraceae bacterium]|jgi:hypothetical protein|nr:hypothetical protein [Oscillospiraceae bacterium]